MTVFYSRSSRGLGITNLANISEGGYYLNPVDELTVATPSKKYLPLLAGREISQLFIHSYLGETPEVAA